MKSADITPRGAVQVRGNGGFHFRSLERGERAVVTEAVADTDFFLFKNGSGTRRCHANCQRRRSADRKKKQNKIFFFLSQNIFHFLFVLARATDGGEKEEIVGQRPQLALTLEDAIFYLARTGQSS